MRVRFSVLILAICGILLLGTEHDAQEIRRINYNTIEVDVVIDRPATTFVDVVVAYHGTVQSDDQIIPAAINTLNRVKDITNRSDVMFVSVAYPQQFVLFGDGIREAEAALLWVRERTRKVLKRKIRKLFLVGHSQGGYMVTRLNTMHRTDGVIANGPGPLNLVYRCGLEETGQAAQSAVCNLLRQTYGTTAANPDAYMSRSLLNFTNGHRSDILFVQGLADSPIQLFSWPTFKQQMTDCTTCQNRQFTEIAGAGHTAMFDHPAGIAAYNAFINR
ncbi:MAG TPA: alpha/beta hydrolase fold domain-containing protein [Pyrinomonadaceae bacterium]|nr:alpha/beta hydrolase fold domain-containing protein [Pyrinomonadaceae bacterium]